MDEDGEMGDDEETRAILNRRDARLRQEEEYGYFLQPLSVQKLNSRILLYNDRVNEMMADFRERLEAKRKIITRMKHRAKELSLKDTAIICARCRATARRRRCWTVFCGKSWPGGCWPGRRADASGPGW